MSDGVMVCIEQEWPGESSPRVVSLRMRDVPRVGDIITTPAGYGRQCVHGFVKTVGWRLFEQSAHGPASYDVTVVLGGRETKR